MWSIDSCFVLPFTTDRHHSDHENIVYKVNPHKLNLNVHTKEIFKYRDRLVDLCNLFETIPNIKDYNAGRLVSYWVIWLKFW